METIQIIEIVISVCMLLLFIAFTITIKRNSENIFFSMRSSNLMIITNIFIFLGIISYLFSDLFYDKMEGKIQYFLTLYFMFQISIFFSLILRYFRLYLSCKDPIDDKVQFNYFIPKSYHYEYFYVRLIAVFTFLVILITTLIFFLSNDDNTLFSYEIIFIKSEISEKNYYFWMIFSFIESLVFLTLYLLIAKTNLNPNVYIKLEIFLVALVNYIYSLSMALSFDIFNDNKIVKNIINIIPIIYNILIYFVVIALPFLYGVSNNTVIIYDLPGELCNSLYLFLTKEKCFDSFYTYLKKNRSDNNYTFYLDFLLAIFKYRLLVNNGESRELIIEEIDNINSNYLYKIKLIKDDKILDKETVNEAINLIVNNRNPRTFKPNIFDKIAGKIYESLDVEFKEFKNKQEFMDLQNELKEETYIRCKLTNFGLIRN